MKTGSMHDYVLLFSVIGCATFTIGLFIYIGITSINPSRLETVSSIINVVETQQELDYAIAALGNMHLLLADMDSDLAFERGRLSGIEDAIHLLEYEHDRAISRFLDERNEHELALQYLYAMLLATEYEDYYLLQQITQAQARLDASNMRINELEEEFEQSIQQIEATLQPYRNMISDLATAHEMLQTSIQHYQSEILMNENYAAYLQTHIENLDRYMTEHRENVSYLQGQVSLLQQEQESIVDSN